MTRLTLSMMIVTLLLSAGLLVGCSSYRTTADKSESARLTLEEEAQVTLEKFEQRDSTLRHFIDDSHGYAVIPEVSKGAAGIGGARGKGVVYEDGEAVGYVTMTQGSVGAQLGGQVYSQLIFFEDALTMQRFKAGNLELSARASAVAASAGAAVDADYEDGVAIFAMPRTGLMFEAAVGGQKFTFESKS